MAGRQSAERLGRFAEIAALWWLRLKGYRILDRRARTAAGELDLVAMRGDILAIVEVKARGRLDTAREAIGARQRARIIRAASLWRARYPRFAALCLRYDLVLIVPWRLPVHERAAWVVEGVSAESLL